jgi:benzoate/toluate 1,2-dioxygenase beta subunit
MRVDDETLRREIEDFLIDEAFLLDGGKTDDWLELFAEDCIYWLPCSPEDDVRQTAIVYEDRRGLEDRLWRLTSPTAYSQQPPSRTLHVIGTVRIVAREADAVVVRSNLMVAEARLGEQRIFAAQCEHRLRRAGDSWKIQQKKITLLTSDFPIRNLTFLI